MLNSIGSSHSKPTLHQIAKSHSREALITDQVEKLITKLNREQSKKKDQVVYKLVNDTSFEKLL